ncbi:MAG TPA: rod shape-determining protein MreC [Chlamydiales bacterium]|nr:rod shape-determining protein MreC [Chlamydiales bacterium]
MNQMLPCFFLGLFLLGWTSLSYQASDRVRSLAVHVFSPAWLCADAIKERFVHRSVELNDPIELSLLKLENQRLKNQIEWVREWALYHIQCGHEEKRPELSELKEQAIPAIVIYRDPVSWGSSLWIGVGEEENEKLQRLIVSRNSPVVIGNSLIGVIDYVGKRQSRVRLITDSSLTPAVRVLRQEYPAALIACIDALSDKMKDWDDLFEVVSQLQKIKETFKSASKEIYLAKGELRGAGAPFWRSKDLILKGSGFNYDYPDAEGPSRDLRSGKVFKGPDPSTPLIVEGDLLVTSGLDGVFPKGLSVGIATIVSPLQEGSFSYEIEARPTACCLNDLKIVFVLPPVSGE